MTFNNCEYQPQEQNNMSVVSKNIAVKDSQSQTQPETQSGSALLVLVSVAVGAIVGEVIRFALSKLRPSKKKNLGAVIGLKPEAYEEYKRFHADVWPGVLDRLRKSNVTNFNIYYCKQKQLLYYHMEYIGDDYDADMKLIAQDPETIRWWKVAQN